MRVAVRVAIALMAAASASSAVAEILVLRSVGPSSSRYPAGRRFPDNTNFVLRSGDSLSVLTPQGTRLFRGQGVHSLNRASSARQQSAMEVRIGTGGVRSPGPAGAQALPNSVWTFAANARGNLCFPQGARPMLWRANTDRAITMVVADAGGREHSAEWPAGEATVAWPASLPIVADAPYRLRMPGASPQRIWLRPIANADALDQSGLAGALIAARCEDQVATFAALNIAPVQQPLTR